jgi:anthranilate phosphoribosyltransferase
MVVINAAAAIIVANIVNDFASAIKIAESSISEGKAATCLEKLVEISNQ